ncbi:MAG: SMC-Scp complex subunit ScpB [Saprospiraceae bacterium]|nr:SMC-Scp complex subunit ScpB [Saprospiraceae bacterium]MDW8230761.1 SMC-Scp complex subunit ScpB [Saprospiraceae bacterium]
MDFLKQHIEALIFVSPQPIGVADMSATLAEAFQAEIPENDLLQAIAQLHEQYQSPEYAFELVEIAGGFQFMTKGAYHNTIAIHLRQTARRRLSQAALETLAIIAYKQPVTKTEIEAIRGVNCDYALQKLLEKELVVISGRSEGPGRPLLYSTSEKFMDYLGIKSLNDLPKPKDFKEIENSVGQPLDAAEAEVHPSVHREN